MVELLHALIVLVLGSLVILGCLALAFVCGFAYELRRVALRGGFASPSAFVEDHPGTHPTQEAAPWDPTKSLEGNTRNHEGATPAASASLPPAARLASRLSGPERSLGDAGPGSPAAPRCAFCEKLRAAASRLIR